MYGARIFVTLGFIAIGAFAGAVAFVVACELNKPYANSIVRMGNAR